MATCKELDGLVDNIFNCDKIDTLQLKEFLKLIARQLNRTAAFGNLIGEEENEEEEYELVNQSAYLQQLILECEERLAKLKETPKTRIVIRNEGHRLQSIIDSVESIREANNLLKSQISDMTAGFEELKRLECGKKQHYQEMIDRLYKDSLNSETCNLRRMYYGLKNQVDELVVKCIDMAKDIATIKDEILILDRIPLLEEKVTTLLIWKASLREEFELFVERYEHVKTVKAGKCEMLDLLDKKVNYRYLEKYVQKITFEAARQEFLTEFDQLKELFCELHHHFSAKLTSLHKEVQMVLSRLASKRRMEK